MEQENRDELDDLVGESVALTWVRHPNGPEPERVQLTGTAVDIHEPEGMDDVETLPRLVIETSDGRVLEFCPTGRVTRVGGPFDTILSTNAVFRTDDEAREPECGNCGTNTLVALSRSDDRSWTCHGCGDELDAEGSPVETPRVSGTRQEGSA